MLVLGSLWCWCACGLWVLLDSGFLVLQLFDLVVWIVISGWFLCGCYGSGWAYDLWIWLFGCLWFGFAFCGCF